MPGILIPLELGPVLVWPSTARDLGSAPVTPAWLLLLVSTWAFLLGSWNVSCSRVTLLIVPLACLVAPANLCWVPEVDSLPGPLPFSVA